MPYIVTITTPKGVSRRAVATLDEAREFCHESVRSFEYPYSGEIHDPAHARLVRQAISLPPEGGTVGPLPDGTTIDVERVDWADLWHDVRPDPPADSPLWKGERIIAAWNALPRRPTSG